jgi:integrase
MKLVFKFAVKWGYLEQNPMAEKRVELPRRWTKRLKKPLQLTAAQFLDLLPLFGLRERLAMAFAGWLGPRISEALGLRWEDLNLNLGVVTFQRGVVQGRVTPLKTEASRTEMSLPEEVVDFYTSGVQQLFTAMRRIGCSPRLIRRASVLSGRTSC